MKRLLLLFVVAVFCIAVSSPKLSLAANKDKNFLLRYHSNWMITPSPENQELNLNSDAIIDSGDLMELANVWHETGYTSTVISVSDVSISDASVYVDIPIEVKSLVGEAVDSFGFDLVYPPDALRLAAIQKGQLTASWLYFDANEKYPGVIAIGGFTVGNEISTSGELCICRFKVISMKSQDITLEIKKFVDDFKEAQAVSGTASISRPSDRAYTYISIGSISKAGDTYSVPVNLTNPSAQSLKSFEFTLLAPLSYGSWKEDFVYQNYSLEDTLSNGSVVEIQQTTISKLNVKVELENAISPTEGVLMNIILQRDNAPDLLGCYRMGITNLKGDIANFDEWGGMPCSVLDNSFHGF